MAAISGVWMATVALLALASFEAVARCRRPGGSWRRRWRPAGGCSSSPTATARDRTRGAGGCAGARPRLALDAVTAGYADEPAVLRDFSLSLEPGRRVALVGASGAGKTTVVNLLLRFLDPRAGTVTLDGRDLRGYRLEDVRRTLAVAGQDSHLFPPASVRTCGWLDPGPATTRSSRPCGAPASTSGWRRYPTGWTRWWARTGERSRADSASASRWPARSWSTRPS